MMGMGINMWISKDGDERKQELIDAAIGLYSEKGYDKTSINDIIAKVGVTKGAFYYYFKSKEDILECITMVQAEKSIEALRSIVDDKTLTAVQKLNTLINSAGASFITNIEQRKNIGKAFEHVDNTRLLYKINDKIVENSKGLLLSIIEQGIREGTFKTEYPEEAAEMYISISSVLKSTIAKQFDCEGTPVNYFERIKRKLSFYIDLIEKLFGLEKGMIKLTE